MSNLTYLVATDPAAEALARGLADGQYVAVSSTEDIAGASGHLVFGEGWRAVVGLPDSSTGAAPAVPDCSAFIAAAHAEPDLTVELAS